MTLRVVTAVLGLLLGLPLAGCAPSGAGSPAASASTAGPVATVATTPTPEPSPSRATPVLTVGACTGNVDLSGATIADVPTVPCDQPHYYEVHASLPVAGDAYPGAEALAEQAKAACSASFQTYVGVEAKYSRFSSAYLTADQAAWADPANRVITCLVGSPDGGLVGSARGDTDVFPSKGQCTGPQDVAAHELALIDCARPHYYEVFATREVPGSKPPTAAQEQKLFSSVCEAGFTDFVGISPGKSKYEVTYFLAAADVWTKVADHRIVCSAGSPSGGVKGSLKGVRK